MKISWFLAGALLLFIFFSFSSSPVFASPPTEKCITTHWFTVCFPIPTEPSPPSWPSKPPFPTPPTPPPSPTPPSKPLLIGAALRDYRQPNRRDCDINVPRQFSTIQSAIDAAVNGNTICVGPGTYNEDVSINKSIQLSGSGAPKTIINGQDPNAQGAVCITADNVTLEGFLINGVGTNFTQVAVAINGSDSGPVSEAIVRYNRIVAGNGGIALRTIRVQNSIIQNNILEGNNSPYVAAEGGLDNVGSLNISFINNTFIGTVNPNTRSDTGITLDAGVPNGLIKQNVFDTTGTMIALIASNNTSVINENNLNSNTTIKIGGGWEPPALNAENNWWGDLDPSDNVSGDVDFTPFATSPFVEN